MSTMAINEVSRAENRKFAWTMAGALSVFGAVTLYRGGQRLPLSLFIVAGLFLSSGLVWPAVLTPVYKAWMKFALVLGWINTRIFLGLFFYLVITPVSLVMKLVKRDALKRKLDRSCSSYWQSRKAMKPAKESYEHLY
ncbi:MAG: SxtJ family membrane protein [Acidobacteriota bacterium]